MADIIRVMSLAFGFTNKRNKAKFSGFYKLLMYWSNYFELPKDCDIFPRWCKLVSLIFAWLDLRILFVRLVTFKFKTLILTTYLHGAKHAQKLCRLMGCKEREWIYNG